MMRVFIAKTYKFIQVKYFNSFRFAKMRLTDVTRSIITNRKSPYTTMISRLTFKSLETENFDDKILYIHLFFDLPTNISNEETCLRDLLRKHFFKLLKKCFIGTGNS